MDYYFAYGTDMDPQELREACPGAEAIGPAYAPGFRIAFNRYRAGAGAWGANLLEDIRFLTWGVLARVPPGELLALDRREGYRIGRPGESSSVRREIEVQVPGHGPVRAWAYFGVPGTELAPEPEPAQPDPAFLQALVAAAEAQDLPFDYIAALRSQPAER